MNNRCARIAIFALKHRIMDILDFREYVLSLPSVEECTPFDETTLVYKIGGRMFACADMEKFDCVVVKHDPDEGEVLRDRYGEITPAWHFNKRYWSSLAVGGDLPETLIRDLIRQSYLYTIRNTVTPKRLREELLAAVAAAGVL